MEPHKITSTMFVLREYSRNTQISPRERATITGFEKVQVVDLAFLRKFFFPVFIYLHLQFVTECDISHFGGPILAVLAFYNNKSFLVHFGLLVSSMNNTSDKVKEALLIMKDITLVIDCVLNFIVEVK